MLKALKVKSNFLIKIRIKHITMLAKSTMDSGFDRKRLILPVGLLTSLGLHAVLGLSLFRWSLTAELPMPVKNDQISYYFYQPELSSTTKFKQTLAAPAAKPVSKEYDYALKAKKSLFDYQLTSADSSKNQQALPPIRMIGEKLLEDPLRMLLGAAITKQLFFPQVAKELYLRGIVGIAFTLFPNGDLQRIRLAHSSGKKILDRAALEAVHRAAPIGNVDIYLKEPKELVINIIY